ncbi:F-box/FBD/LRR-repeat protein At1g13570-like [Spinacia oleracea]|uniref:F-box/FBD/LRR-repeat protein At1g13570-like n=1 Tax=Spinacia oleracea TaxID=3562 RepID=A0ABM3R8N8_SPIOL|nr:F-box/FBD/LRR-repeat protein At1g13570-like [Spinacia oleracea]
MAARMGVLSTKWKAHWLSLRHLRFDEAFWDEVGEDKGSSIVSNILFHHKGPLQKFSLFIPPYSINLSQWLSFVSRTGVKNIFLFNWYDDDLVLPSHIFECKELMKLKLRRFVLNHLPRDFKGFANLRSLELYYIECNLDDFGSLISNCPRLTLLRLENYIGLGHFIIDVPSLESLVIKHVFCYISFINVVRLTNISLDLDNFENPQDNAIVYDSFQYCVAYLYFNLICFFRLSCKFLDAGAVVKWFPLAFNHMSKLCLSELKLGRADVYHFVFHMVQSCPFIKELKISFWPDKAVINAVQQEHDCDGNYKLAHLLKVKITEITGSLAELKFIEYVLAISVVLEKFFFNFIDSRNFRGANSEVQVLRDLLQLPRASPKAQLVWLK